MRRTLFILIFMLVVRTLAQQPLAQVTYFFDIPEFPTPSEDEPQDVPSYARAIETIPLSEVANQVSVFMNRDGQTIDHKLAQWTDLFMAPQTRTVCVLWAKIDIPFDETAADTAKVCIGHRYQFKTSEVELFLQVGIGNAADPQEVRSVIDEALKLDAPALAAAALVDCYITGCGNALATAKVDFIVTLEAYVEHMGGLGTPGDDFGFEIETRSGWSDWK
jgi:hypothetical protein